MGEALPDSDTTQAAQPEANTGTGDSAPDIGAIPAGDEPAGEPGSQQDGEGEGKAGAGDTDGQEEEIAVSPEDLDDYFAFMKNKREREQAASQLAGQSGEQPGKAPATAPPPPAAAQQEEYTFEPFKIADEFRDSCLDTPENLEGLLHSSGIHYMQAGVNETLGMVIEAVQMMKAAETKTEANRREEYLATSRIQGRMDRFFELPENDDVTGYPDRLRVFAYEEAAAKHPQAPEKELFKHTAQILRDGVRFKKLLERNLREGHDVRPARKAPKDSPRTGGNVDSGKQQNDDEPWHPMAMRLGLRSER